MAVKDLKATVHTLGCRLNQSESSIMEKSLEKQGYSLVPFKKESDLAIINTCTVTARADSDCRHVIQNYIKRNEAFVAVVGCYSQMGYKVLADIEGVDVIMGNKDKLDIVNYIKQGKSDKPLILRDRIVRDDFTKIDYIGQSDSHTRANLKIQDGCDFMCTFCIIPMARDEYREVVTWKIF